MGRIEGKCSVEIAAPVQECFAIAADIEQATVWQGSLREVRVLSRDAQGRPDRVETVSDAKVRHIKSLLRFTYDEPASIRWRQEKGDAKDIHGGWDLEDLGGDRTRATYWLQVDPGRVIGFLLRGPAEHRVRDFLLGHAADGLKGRAEQSG
jgi:hypothetical protein